MSASISTNVPTFGLTGGEPVVVRPTPEWKPCDFIVGDLVRVLRVPGFASHPCLGSSYRVSEIKEHGNTYTIYLDGSQFMFTEECLSMISANENVSTILTREPSVSVTKAVGHESMPIVVGSKVFVVDVPGTNLSDNNPIMIRSAERQLPFTVDRMWIDRDGNVTVALSGEAYYFYPTSLMLAQYTTCLPARKRRIVEQP